MESTRIVTVHIIIIFIVLETITTFGCRAATTSTTRPQKRGHMRPLGNQGAPHQPVEQLEFAPSGKEFYHRYLRQSKPVVIRGVAKKWPVYAKLKNLQYLKDFYGDELYNVEFRKKFENTFPIRKTWKLSQFLDEYQRKQVYLDSLFPKNSKLAEEIHLPFALNCKKLNNGIDNLNFLMSSGNTSSAFHEDGYENLLSVIAGVKKVILYDSKHIKLLEADNFTLAAGVSQLDPESVDLERYPVMAELPYLSVTLNPGDMLYIPQHWWHQVRSYHNPNIAIGIWFSVFNFGEEFEKRNIDETQHITKAAETFRELLQNEPTDIACEDGRNSDRNKLYTIMHTGDFNYRRHYSCSK